MTLAEIAPNSSCRIVTAADSHSDLQSRFYALGLFPGADVEVLRYAPAGDPIQVKVGGSTLLSIRKQEALLVNVEVSK